ncbi:hypothetical protein DIPPA_16617 [Diplonema papillatum]|nr:hypothetical protein DIPPA_16617 [Diplonema papillatum]
MSSAVAGCSCRRLWSRTVASLAENKYRALRTPVPSSSVSKTGTSAVTAELSSLCVHRVDMVRRDMQATDPAACPEKNSVDSVGLGEEARDVSCLVGYAIAPTSRGVRVSKTTTCELEPPTTTCGEDVSNSFLKDDTNPVRRTSHQVADGVNRVATACFSTSCSSREGPTACWQPWDSRRPPSSTASSKSTLAFTPGSEYTVASSRALPLDQAFTAPSHPPLNTSRSDAASAATFLECEPRTPAAYLRTTTPGGGPASFNNDTPPGPG